MSLVYKGRLGKVPLSRKQELLSCVLGVLPYPPLLDDHFIGAPDPLHEKIVCRGGGQGLEDRSQAHPGE